MKRKFSNIFMTAFVITTLGFLMDKDSIEPNAATRFGEFFGMVVIVFALIAIFYFSSNFVLKRFQRI